MNVIEVNLAEIRPYEHNPRNNKHAVAGVAESIKQFGFQQPIVLDKKNEIVCGHTRYLAAKQLGLETVPCVYASDLTPKQVKAYRLLDNRLNEEAKWNFALLAKELEDIDFDFSQFNVDFKINEVNLNANEKNIETEVHNEPEFLNSGLQDNREKTFKLIVNLCSVSERNDLAKRLQAEGYVITFNL